MLCWQCPIHLDCTGFNVTVLQETSKTSANPFELQLHDIETAQGKLQKCLYVLLTIAQPQKVEEH